MTKARQADCSALLSQRGVAAPAARVRGGMLGAVRILFAAEDHGAGTQHVRFRISPRHSRAAALIALLLLALAGEAAVHGDWIASALVGAISAVFLGRSVFECAVASASALGCLGAIERAEEEPMDVVLGQLAVDRAGAPLPASRT